MLKTVASINHYQSVTVNPLASPEQMYELYSVPSFDTSYPEIIMGGDIGSTKVEVQENDVLICKINPRINRIWVVKHNTEYPLIASSEWIVVRSSENDPTYLKWYFSSEPFKRLMVSQVTGIGGSLTRAQPKQVATYPVPIPDLPTQRRIAATLDKVSEGIAVCRQMLADLDLLVKSQFVEMFVDKYNTVKVGDVIKTTSGGTPSRSHSEYYEGGTIPWLTSGEVNAGIITGVKNYITEDGMNNSSAKMVPANSVVIAMYGATAGVTGITKIDTTTNQAVCSLLPSERYIPEYLYYAVSAKKNWMIAQCKGGGQPNISQGIIKEMDLIDAPLKEQDEFARFVKQADKSKCVIQQQLSELETLKKSLMQQYFS